MDSSVKSKELVEKLKAKLEDEKRESQPFRLRTSLVSRFKDKCDALKLKHCDVVEMLFEEFLKGHKVEENADQSK